MWRRYKAVIVSVCVLVAPFYIVTLVVFCLFAFNGPGNPVENMLRSVVFFNTQQHDFNMFGIRRIIRKHEWHGTKQNG